MDVCVEVVRLFLNVYLSAEVVYNVCTSLPFLRYQWAF